MSAQSKRVFRDDELIECAEREAKMRRDKYPRMDGGMTPQRMKQTLMMEEIVTVLREKLSPEPQQPQQAQLFDTEETAQRHRGAWSN